MRLDAGQEGDTSAHSLVASSAEWGDSRDRHHHRADAIGAAALAHERDELVVEVDDLDARVIVFNCECHTYEQVIALFCQYIPGMNSTKAFELAWKIDHEGEAIVFAGTLTEAEEIAAKLGGGGLRVAVQ
jgi:ATP-dependent Clp protease adaptor protein ClpS